MADDETMHRDSRVKNRSTVSRFYVVPRLRKTNVPRSVLRHVRDLRIRDVAGEKPAYLSLVSVSDRRRGVKPRTTTAGVYSPLQKEKLLRTTPMKLERGGLFCVLGTCKKVGLPAR